jgi:two-component system NtrC family sensor kinase
MKYVLLCVFCFFIIILRAQKIEVYNGIKLNIDSVSKDLSSFDISNSQIVNFGLTERSRVLMITENLNSQMLVSIDNPTIDSVSFFCLYNNKVELLRMEDMGYSKVFENNLGFDTILVKVKSSTQLVIPVSFNFRKNIVSNNNEIENFFFFFIGIMISVLLYNLFIFISTKDFIYLRYVIFIFFIGITQLFLYGQISKGLNNLLGFGYYWVQLAGALSGIVTIVFSRSFLRLKDNANWIYRITNLSLLSYALTLVLILLDNALIAYQMININASLSILLLIGAFISLRKGFRSAIYFIVAFSTFLVGVTIFALKDFGLIEYNLFSKYALPVGVIIEAILLSLALADRINILKREKEASQIQAMSMMEENQRLVHEQKSILEQEVNLRTSELQASKNNLEKTVHDLQLTQKQLVESEKLASLGQMTAGIAHEINNPVNFVRSNVQPLKRDVDELLEIINEFKNPVDELDLPTKWDFLLKRYQELDIDYLQKEIHQLLNGIDEGSKRTADIVRSLRVFSRMDRDVLVLADVNECILSTLMVMKNITSKEATVITELEPQLPQIMCFPGKLNQVLMNLISNAVHATKMENRGINDRLVTVKTVTQNDKIQIVVKDNGSGMKDEVRKKIFDPFFTTKQVGEGTGLGLSIVLGIVHEHGGEINVESEWGTGTSFIITLPMSPQPMNHE